MKNTYLLQILSLLTFFLTTSACSENKKKDAIDIKKNTVHSGLIPDPIEALSNPSKHAWDLFLYVNHPAADINQYRGEPDLNKKIGEVGIVVWETWKHAGTEVFLEDGSAPPAWEDYSLDPYLSKKGKTLEPSTAALIAELKNKSKDQIQTITKSFVSNPSFNPEDGLIGNGGETRMNKSTFDFIVKNELYNIEGIEKFRTTYLSTPPKSRKELSFDKQSIEVKGMWKEFTNEELKNKLDQKYYVAIGTDGKKYGLTSLHIITKEVPNWFWCSFRHTDGPTPLLPSVDDYGQPKELSGTFWQNYELSGTQTTFTDPRGKPTKLSDPHIEDGFENSSCISCHSTATAGPKGVSPLLFTHKPVIGSGKVGEIFGTPNESWFVENGEEYVPLDFVYSIPFRARNKTVTK